VCKIVTSNISDPQESDGSSDDDAPAVDTDPISAPLKHMYSAEQRETIGGKCKRLLDFCRLQFLKSTGYDVFLAQYCHKQISPENIAMIAIKQHNSQSNSL
jgi:hypothetical protein